MTRGGKRSYSSLIVLQALDNGYHYGFDIMAITGMHSGTVYPILRRLEHDGLARSQWENQAVALKQQRPRRRYYETTRLGRQTLREAAKRSPALESMLPHLPHKTKPSQI